MITRDYLYSADAGTNAQALADWLTENATEYFDECTAEDMTVSCTRGETILMQITLSATIITIKAADASGELAALAGTIGSAVRRIYYAWKCSHGIMLGISEIPTIFITKDAADRVACAAWTNLTTPGSASTAVRLNVLSTAAPTSINAGFIPPQISGKTVLSPILVTDNDGTVLPYMYYTPYSQYNDAGILTVDGTEYLYSGCIAICDGEAGASGSADLSNYYTKGQTDAKIAEVRGNVEENAAKIANMKTQSKANADAITALSEHVADATVTAASMSGDYIDAWNAFHHWREGNTLHINGNFKLNGDVPAGATLITLPLTVYWGYCIVVHGGKWHMAQLTGNTLRLPAGIALAVADGVNVTVIATGRINAGEQV